MATHSSVLAWRIPGTGEPGGLPSLGSHRVRHDWSDLAAAVKETISVAWAHSVRWKPEANVEYKQPSYLAGLYKIRNVNTAHTAWDWAWLVWSTEPQHLSQKKKENTNKEERGLLKYKCWKCSLVQILNQNFLKIVCQGEIQTLKVLSTNNKTLAIWVSKLNLFQLLLTN